MRFEDTKPAFQPFSIVVESRQELEWLEDKLSRALSGFDSGYYERDFISSLVNELKARIET